MKVAKFFMFILILIFTQSPKISSNLQADENAIKDKDITEAVYRQLLLDEAVPSYLIDIETKEGVVTLSGSVNNILAKERALTVAGSVRGVRSKIDRLEVKPKKRSDEQIRKDVIKALKTDPATELMEVNAKVNKGVVTLIGRVESYAERNLCAEVAKGVKGVTDLKNEVEVNYKHERPDEDIKNDIKRRLDFDVWIDSPVSVDVKNGEVTLEGSVVSEFAKQRVKSKSWVAGVKSVDAESLEIKWWMRNEMERKKRYSNLSDEDIKSAVQDAFKYDPRILPFTIEANVDNGVLIITGDVSNLKAKYAAEENAKNTIGVWRVINRIRVRPKAYIRELSVSMEKDREATIAIENALSRDPYIDSYDITVYVHNSKARLYGTVDSQFEKYHTEDIVSRVKGVAEIENYIKYHKKWKQKDDLEIKQDIRDELFWSPFVDSDEIKIDVEDGTATLKGTVGTWFEFNKAQENAFEGGARWVKNNLKVEFGPIYYLPL
ncbi:BON domain-containing protein [Candidatus Poribacteria bacterium]|nr:BON domain-containing protein [Candidatus Poribacteria bacterium]